MAGSGGTFRSRLTRATRYSASLRTTVPQVIAELLELHSGDSLVWTVDASGTRIGVSRSIPGSHPTKDPHRVVVPGSPNAFDLAWTFIKAPAARRVE